MRRRIRLLAAAIACVVAVSLPTIYFFVEARSQDLIIETELEINARLFSQIISADPEHWDVQTHRLEALLDRRPKNRTPEIRSLYDANGRLVAESRDELAWPVHDHHQAPVHDSGRVVGTLRISRSAQALLLESAMVGLIGLALASAIFVCLSTLPLRALKRATEDLLRERERTQAIELERQAAEAASQAKAQFLAHMSHEIRTPMNGVLGMTELLLETRLTDTQRRFATTAHRSGQSLLAIINDILDFSKIEAGKLTLEQIAFDTRECIRELMDLLAPRAQQKGLELSCRIDDNVPAQVRGDPGRLRQVLLNLIGNAIKFTHQGRILVELQAQPVACSEGAATEAQCMLRFQVSDTGVGISKEGLSRLFQAFSQADGSTTRKYGGTGLGLAISKQLVELMRGAITVASTPGRGSTFAFSVRLGMAERVASTQEAESERGWAATEADVTTGAAPEPSLAPTGIGVPPAGARLLLAEDNLVNQEFAVSLLALLGCEVDVASDGVQAVAMFRARRYELILMDMQMPHMDGLAASAEIRRLEHERSAFGAADAPPRTPIVALTANAMAGDRERCMAAGMDDYLSKPFGREQMQALLQRWLPARGAHESSVLDTQESVAIDVDAHEPTAAEVDAHEPTAAEVDAREPTAAEVHETAVIEVHEPIAVAAATAAVVSLSTDGESARNAEAAAVIDETALDAIRALQRPGKPDVVQRIVSAYLAEAPRLAESMRLAALAQDVAAVGAAAHVLKSSSANVGAVSLAQVCREIETRARRDGMLPGDALMASMGTELARAVAALGSRLRDDCRRVA